MTMKPSSPRLLVADDDPAVLEALRLLLKGEGFQVETATSPGGVLSAVETRDFDAALIDMNYTRDTTGGIEGLDLISRIQTLDASLPVIVMTAWGSIEGAVEAMRRGARDYIEKPWDNARLLQQLRTQIELGRAIRMTQRLENENRTLRRDGTPELVATSPAMQPVLRLMERVAPSDANALVVGEHGTGKEVVARWLHAAVSLAVAHAVAFGVRRRMDSRQLAIGERVQFRTRDPEDSAVGVHPEATGVAVGLTVGLCSLVPLLLAAGFNVIRRTPPKSPPQAVAAFMGCLGHKDIKRLGCQQIGHCVGQLLEMYIS